MRLACVSNIVSYLDCVIGRLQPQVYATGALPLVGKIYDTTTGLVCASVVIEDKCGAKGWVSQELYEPFRVTVSDVCYACASH